jgi:2-succinyl-5-enolpyruvyl-6-hydroxy-3-cyclohexene-1-carboxylate synthase
MSSSTDLARAVVTALVEAGLREIVVAPGSRNAPLSFAAYDAAQAGAVRLHTRLDERSAGFLALGLTKVGSSAAVICTSGTAVANLHPAMLEAAHAGVPLVAITADRPARLRGTDANQTTDQVGIFGPLIPTHDLWNAGIVRDVLHANRGETAADRHGLPLHLNVQLDDPLVPGERWADAPSARTERQRGPFLGGDGEVTTLEAGPRTVVIAGDDAGPPARMLAQEAGWPLLAEPSSGSRTGDNVVRTYRLLLGDDDLAGRIQQVVVFGHPTLSRPVSRLLARDDVEMVAVRGPSGWSDPGHHVHVVADAVDLGGVRPEWFVGDVDPQTAPPSPWLDEWLTRDRDLARRLDALLAARGTLTPHQVAGAVSAAVPPGGLLFVGASNPVRDLDLMVAPYAVGDRRMVVANRGLAGIDGSVSSAVGAALGRPHSTRALALLGDVTFLHDAAGLVLGPEEDRPDLTVVVVNDDGGSVFASLEQGAPQHAPSYERLFGTPHGVDLAAVCAATRTPHWRVDSLEELRHALASPAGGIEVVEAVVRRDDRRELDAAVRGLVADA